MTATPKGGGLATSARGARLSLPWALPACMTVPEQGRVASNQEEFAHERDEATRSGSMGTICFSAVQTEP